MDVHILILLTLSAAATTSLLGAVVLSGRRTAPRAPGWRNTAPRRH